jgi:hypothetical protein
MTEKAAAGPEPFLLGAVKWGSRRPQRWPAWAARIGLSQKSNDCCGNTSPMSDARSAFPGDLATPEEVLRLADSYRQAALALAGLGTAAILLRVRPTGTRRPRNRALPERSALAGGTPAQPHSRPPTRFLRSGRSGDNMRIAVSKADGRASEDDRRDPRTPGHTLWAGTDVYAHAAESLGCDTRRDCNQSALRHVKGSLDGFASN